ncbi:MAG: hypothetical protein ACKO0W_04065, partial [Planctomycetota bacterium]
LIEPADDERDAARRILAHVAALGLGALAYARVDLARGPDGAPLLMELEALEPSLFLDRAPEQAAMLVEAVITGGRASGDDRAPQAPRARS